LVWKIPPTIDLLKRQKTPCTCKRCHSCFLSTSPYKFLAYTNWCTIVLAFTFKNIEGMLKSIDCIHNIIDSEPI
jgi:hypothetical protein